MTGRNQEITPHKIWKNTSLKKDEALFETLPLMSPTNRRFSACRLVLWLVEIAAKLKTLYWRPWLSHDASASPVKLLVLLELLSNP
ncbi:hypothetical protein YC2023_010048 [Brassica napus]